MDAETKKRIDEMDYESMLRLWRNAPAGHPMFHGETGQYFSEVMKAKSEQVGPAERARASKAIGWD